MIIQLNWNSHLFYVMQGSTRRLVNEQSRTGLQEQLPPREHTLNVHSLDIMPTATTSQAITSSAPGGHYEDGTGSFPRHNNFAFFGPRSGEVFSSNRPYTPTLLSSERTSTTSDGGLHTEPPAKYPMVHLYSTVSSEAAKCEHPGVHKGSAATTTPVLCMDIESANGNKEYKSTAIERQQHSRPEQGAAGIKEASGLATVARHGPDEARPPQFLVDLPLSNQRVRARSAPANKNPVPLCGFFKRSSEDGPKAAAAIGPSGRSAYPSTPPHLTANSGKHGVEQGERRTQSYWHDSRGRTTAWLELEGGHDLRTHAPAGDRRMEAPGGAHWSRPEGRAGRSKSSPAPKKRVSFARGDVVVPPPPPPAATTQSSVNDTLEQHAFVGHHHRLQESPYRTLVARRATWSQVAAARRSHRSATCTGDLAMLPPSTAWVKFHRDDAMDPQGVSTAWVKFHRNDAMSPQDVCTGDSEGSVGTSENPKEDDGTSDTLNRVSEVTISSTSSFTMMSGMAGTAARLPIQDVHGGMLSREHPVYPALKKSLRTQLWHN
jgi:hypothetical protein